MCTATRAASVIVSCAAFGSDVVLMQRRKSRWQQLGRMQAKVRLVEALLATGDIRRADETLAQAIEDDPSFRKSELFASLCEKVKAKQVLH